MISWLIKNILGKQLSTIVKSSTLNGGDKPSSRKLTAYLLITIFVLFQFVYVYLLVSTKHEVTPELLVEFRWVLFADLIGAFLLMGVVTVQQVMTILKDKSVQQTKIAASKEVKTKQLENDKEVQLAKENKIKYDELG